MHSLNFGMNISESFVELVLVDIREYYRNFELANEEQCKLASHQTSTDNTNLAYWLSQLGIRCTSRLLRTLLNQIKRIHRSLELVSNNQRSNRFVFAGEGSFFINFACLFEKFESSIGRLGNCAQFLLHALLGNVDGQVPLGQALYLAGLVGTMRLVTVKDRVCPHD